MTHCHRSAAWLLGVLLLGASPASAQPIFTQLLSPSTIGPGSTTTLTFTVQNPDATAASDLAFTASLPVTVTTRASTSCVDALLTTTATDVVLTGGRLGALSSCVVRVDVTATSSATLPAVDLSSSAGASAAPAVDLTVDTARPGFALSAAPSVVPFAGTTTLTYSIDNTASSSAQYIRFSHSFPPGVLTADPANAATTCTYFPQPFALPSTPNAPGFEITGAGGNLQVPASSSCTVSVDVTASNTGFLDLATGDLTAFYMANYDCGFATTTLEVEPLERIHLLAQFRGDPVVPGGTVDMDVTIFNRDRDDTATAIAFSYDMDATLAGMTAAGLPLSDVCGTGSTFTSTGSAVELQGGTLPPGETCSFAFALDIPNTATYGLYASETSAVSAVIGGGPIQGNIATDVLIVAAMPEVAFDVLDATTREPEPVVGAGDEMLLSFTLTNTNPADGLTNLALTTELTTVLPVPVSVSLPPSPNPPCGVGSNLTLASLGVDSQGLALTGGSLDAGTSCTFEVAVTVPETMASGTYVFETSFLIGSDSAGDVWGRPDDAAFSIVEGPTLRHEYVPGHVAAGDTATLRYTLSLGDGAPAGATAVSFTHDLDAVISGLVATVLPPDGTCGGSLTGDTLLTFAGGTLDPGESCTFDVTVQTPVTAAGGSHTSLTSATSGTINGVTAAGPPSRAELLVGGVTVDLTISPRPASPGATVTGTFVLANTSAADDASNAQFTLQVSEPPGITILSVPSTPCGAGSSITLIGGTFMLFTGGSILAGQSCEFSIEIAVPAGAAEGTYRIISSNVTATVGAASVVTRPASATLVIAAPLLLEKRFVPSRAFPGATVSVEYTLYNSSTEDATGLTFTDDFGAAQSGLEAVGLPIAVTDCGAGATISGTGVVTFSGGSLTAGMDCTFAVDLLLPAPLPRATVIVSSSSVLSGNLGSSNTGATAVLAIDHIAFSHTLANPAAHGATTTITYTIDNTDSGDGINGLRFAHDLEAVLAGAVATDLPQVDVCGLGSTLSGSSVVQLDGGNLGAGATCSFAVTMQIPTATDVGDYDSATTELTAAGTRVAPTSTAVLTVIPPPPLFTPSVAPAQIDNGGTTTLTFTIDNTGGNGPAASLAFSDSLLDDLVVATPANATTDCGGGAWSVVEGTSGLAFAGGSVAAHSTCTFAVDITSDVVGSYTVSPAALSSSSGTSPSTQAAVLDVVVPPPLFSVAVDPTEIVEGESATLTFTIDNGAGNGAVTGASWADALPAGLVAATPSNAATTCNGSVTAVEGSGSLAFTIDSLAANESCSASVDITSAVGDVYTYSPADLSSSAGLSPSSNGLVLTVATAPPAFAVRFDPDSVQVNEPSTLTFEIDNSTGGTTITAVALDDLLPEGLSLAQPSNETTDCNGTLNVDLSGTTVSIGLSGGSVAAASACTISVDVTSSVAGTYTFDAADLTSSAGSSPASQSATLTVTAADSGGGSPDSGCDCRASGNSSAWLVLLGVPGMLRRRRRV